MLTKYLLDIWCRFILQFRVFAKLQHRLDPRHGIPPIKFIFAPSIQLLSFQSVTHSSTQREQHIFFPLNHFRTLFTATEGVGVLPPHQPSSAQFSKNSRQTSPFCSNTYKMPLAQLLSFDNDPFSSGGYPLPWIPTAYFPFPIPYFLSFHILAHSFALTENSTRLFSSDSALFAKNHPGWGEGVASC
jgi:hypothetical protein